MSEMVFVRTVPVAHRTAGVALEVLTASVAPAVVAVSATASAPTDFAALLTAGVEVDLPIVVRMDLIRLPHLILLQFHLLSVLPLPPAPAAPLDILQSTGIRLSPLPMRTLLWLLVEMPMCSRHCRPP